MIFFKFIVLMSIFLFFTSVFLFFFLKKIQRSFCRHLDLLLAILSFFYYFYISHSCRFIAPAVLWRCAVIVSTRAAYKTARSSSIDSRHVAVSRQEQGERRRQEAAILRLRRTWRKRRATNYSFDNDQALVKATSRHCYARAISLTSR